MQITWYGQSCFKITSGDLVVILSPFNKKIGLNPPRGKADIVLFSDNNSSDELPSFEGGFVINGEGEYEVKGVLISGVSYYHGEKNRPRKSTVYTIEIEGVSICHLDNASKLEVESILDKIGAVDILMIPVGGKHKLEDLESHTLNAEEAVGIVGEIEPRIVIPMYYQVPKLSVKLDGADKFLKAMGAEKTEFLSKFSVKKKDLPQGETKVVALKLE